MGESDKEDDKITCLVGRDRWTVVTFAHVVKGKGLTDEWIVENVYEDLRSLGYPEIRLRADNEPSIKALLDKVKDLRDHRGCGTTQVEDAVEGQPQTNRVAEKGVQDLTTQCRKYKVALETRIKEHIHARSVIFKWIVRHSADTINLETTGHDGKVPLQRLHNKLPKPIDVESREHMLAKVLQYKNKRRRSL